MTGFVSLVDRLLWSGQENYFKGSVRESAKFMKFKAMQWVRFLFILPLVIVWGLNFYVNVKKCIMYLNFWALTATLLYLLCIFPSAGRLQVEAKLLEKNKQIEEKELSRSWKLGLFFNSLAWPLTVTSVVLFSLFLSEEQVCSTYFDFGFAPWRGVVVFIATYFPMLVLVVDFLINSVVFSYKHLLTNVVFFLFYIFITFIGSTIQNRPIYANHLAFRGTYGNNYQMPSGNATDWAVVTAHNCMDNVFHWTPIGDSDSFTVQGWSKNLWITLGTGLGTLILVHVLMTALSQCRYKMYYGAKLKSSEKFPAVNDTSDPRQQSLLK